MVDVIVIRHKFTANTVATIVTMPGKPAITKRWKRKRSGGFGGDFLRFWNEESLPAEVAEAAEAGSGRRVCDVLKR